MDNSHFTLDTKASQFTVHAFASGLASVVAHNPKFAIHDFVSDAKFEPSNPLGSTLRMTVNLESLSLLDDVSEYDRREITRIMFDEVLEVRKFPKAIYQSSKVSASKISENMYRAELCGSLTLHGLTRQIDFPAQIVSGEDSLRGYGEFTLNQSEYGIRVPTVANGAIKMKDQVKLAFFMVGRKA
ncbi:MAG: YceI family protein [Candidatus Acidiferrales bacterium]